MLDNLKVVLRQHKRFLVIFFIVIFLPSVVLAFFGIRAIYNERYKLQQQNIEHQKEFVKVVQTGLLTHIERNSSKLKELSLHRVFSEKDYAGIRDLIAGNLKDGMLFGYVVVWGWDKSPWIPEFQAYPPGIRTLSVPDEWKKWQHDLGRAEIYEFRSRNYSEAVSQYRRILDRAEDDQVKAWLLSRIARCEIKREKYPLALNAYRSIIADFPDLFTESGRPLEIASRLAMLDAFSLEKDYESFFPESLRTFRLLEQNTWSLEGEQIKVYATSLKDLVDGVVDGNSSEYIPENYVQSIDGFLNTIDEKIRIWQLAEAVRQKILPDARERVNLNDDSPTVQKSALAFEGDDILVFWIPLDKEKSGSNGELLGLLIQTNDLTETIDTQIKESGPSDISVVLRSSLSDNIVFGGVDENQVNAVLTDFFPDNFPPWRFELYQEEDDKLGFSLHKNIFFWTILALLVIVFFGSGLMIRTIIQEVNLLNLKSEFITSVSHEFKTPLTAMGAVLERLLSEEVKDPKKTKEYYRILSHDSERLKRLVKNVLDFTKIEDGKRDYKLISTDIAQLVRQEVKSFQEENKMTGITVDIEIDDDIPDIIADEEAMSQALHNILDNAAKFSGNEKNIHVKIIRRQDSVEIAVLDGGVGISENEQKKVFEKFYRGKMASSVSPTGTGLGLTLVKHIMDAHSGDVIIESKPGKGTCVSLILPFGKGG
jgi:signal transduction histidine kinase